MNTFTRLSTISTSDIVYIRDKYYEENPREQEHGWFRGQHPVESLSSGSEDEKTVDDGHVAENGYKEMSYEEEEEEEARLCGTMRNQVVVMAPIFGFFGKVDTKVWYSLILLLLLVTHICVGAHVFKILETGEKATNITNDNVWNRDFLTHYLTVEGSLRPDNKTRDRLTYDQLHVVMKGLYSNRCFKTDNIETDANMWNFWTSFDFVSTIVSTIGYGGMAPRTETGKLFVIIYTIPGMLLMMSYLNIFSTCILIVLRKIIKTIRKLSNLKRMPDVVEQMIVLWVSLLFLCSYLLVMAALMHLQNKENDSFPQSLYFYVITMTTVGFGDITLIDHSYLALIRVLFVFCVGLVLVSLVFNAIRELAAAYQRRLVEVSQRIAMKTLAVAKQHRLKHSNAIDSGEEKLMGVD